MSLILFFARPNSLSGEVGDMRPFPSFLGVDIAGSDLGPSGGMSICSFGRGTEPDMVMNLSTKNREKKLS